MRRALLAGALATLVLAAGASGRPGAQADRDEVTVAVTALDSGFRLSRKSVPAGRVRFAVENRGTKPHDFSIAGRKTRALAPGERAVLAVRLVATGGQEFKSTLPGDVRRGLRGVLSVLERGVKVTRIGRFAEPVFVTALPGDERHLFVVEKRGRVRVLVDGRLRPQPFLDLSAEVGWAGNEQGLLGLAFAPDYERSGLFYVYFTDQEENARLVEYRRSRSNPDRADPESGRLVVHVEQPSGEHYAGMLLFDSEGFLLFGLGDGGLHRNREPMRAQWGDRLHGKILRIDPRARDAGAYGIPPGNPDLGAGWRPEIWAYGLRNPWRFWIDRETGDFYVGDVGEFVRESIDYAPAGMAAGTNFGWPCFEGGLPSTVYGPESCPGAVPPLFEYAREGVNCAVVGGLVVRDPRLPGLAGRYLFADYCGGEIESLRVAAGRAVLQHLGLARLPGLTSFGEDALGRVYVTTLSGAVYRLDPRLAPLPPDRPVTDGRRIFVSSGCGGCHTLAAAGATGTVGPSLDVAKPSFDLVVERVTRGTAQMPSFKDVLSEQQIESVASFVVEATRPK